MKIKYFIGFLWIEKQLNNKKTKEIFEEVMLLIPWERILKKYIVYIHN